MLVAGVVSGSPSLRSAMVAMPGFGDVVKKAFYLGVGLASYAGEQASGKLGELRSQAQKLADELVAKGEMNTEEAKRFVEDIIKQAQQPPGAEPDSRTTPAEPRRIEILSDEEEPVSTEPTEDRNVQNLRDQVQGLQEELQRLKRKQ